MNRDIALIEKTREVYEQFMPRIGELLRRGDQLHLIVKFSSADADPSDKSVFALVDALTSLDAPDRSPDLELIRVELYTLFNAWAMDCGFLRAGEDIQVILAIINPTRPREVN